MQQILLFIISLILKLTFAQQKEKTIKGIVKENNGVIVYAHVLNKTTNEGTITNEQGMFSIKVSLGDELQVTSIQHQTKVFVVDKKIFETETLNIKMRIKTNLLEEVAIKKHQLSGNLLFDIKKISNKHEKQEKQLNDLVLKIKKEKTIHKTKTNGNISIPLGNRRLRKEREEKQQLQQRKDFPDKLLQSLGSYFFFNKLKIPKEKYYHFISFCEVKNIQSLHQSKKTFQLIEILKQESLIYLKEIKN